MELTIKIDERSNQAKAFIAYLKTLPFIEMETMPRYNAETEKTIKDVRLRKNITHSSSHLDLMKKLTK